MWDRPPACSGGGATIRARMRALELFGEELPAGPVRLIVRLPEEDEAGASSALGVAREWSAELDDPPAGECAPVRSISRL
jgi:hypothetical protein